MRRPVYFEKLLTVLIDEVSLPPKMQSAPIANAKDVLGWLRTKSNMLLAEYRPLARFTQPVLDTRHINAANNLAHLLIDVLPVCLFARDTIGLNISFVFSDFPRALELKIRDLLGVLGIIPFIATGRICGPIIHIRGSRGLSVFSLHSAFDCPMLTFFPEVYQRYDFRTSTRFDKVFIARRGNRALTNHSEVECFLGARGYTTIYMEDFSVRDQMSIGAQAQHVVAVHGAAMAFLALGKNIESVIELSPPHVYHELFPVALGCKVQNYVLLIPTFDERVTQKWDAILHFKNSAFEVDLGQLDLALALINGESVTRPHPKL
jgi:Glycosyltransferase 61